MDMELVIFGAQGIALGAYRAICSLYPRRKPQCFLVSKLGRNPQMLGGLPVLEAAGFARGLSKSEKENVEVLIATPENVMDDIESTLEESGLRCYSRLTSLRWADLMGYYYAQEKSCIPLAALPIGWHRPQLHMFMAKFYKDAALTEAFDIPEWITPIQVGAQLCKERVADLLDCEGENISSKNGNYSELTALYWIWKNLLTDRASSGPAEYFGLAHYRRILHLTEDDIRKLPDNGVDVVLPYPMPYEPDIEAHHSRYLSGADWNAVLAALRELQPEYAEGLPGILGQQYFYNYNIILARGDVLADYCAWLFPILERIESLSVPRGWERYDRYMGYIGETLETLYFMYNRDRLNIVHTGCRFLT